MLSMDTICYIRNRCLFLYRIEESINKTLGLLPFLTIGDFFIDTSARIALFVLKVQSFDNFYLIYFWSEYIIIALIHISMIIILNHIKNHKNNNYKSLFVQIYNHLYNDRNEMNSLDNKINSLINEIKIMEEFTELDAWNIFNIDKRLVISFLSSVIPFSVMLIQFKYE